MNSHASFTLRVVARHHATQVRDDLAVSPAACVHGQLADHDHDYCTATAELRFRHAITSLHGDNFNM